MSTTRQLHFSSMPAPKPSARAPELLSELYLPVFLLVVLAHYKQHTLLPLDRKHHYDANILQQITIPSTEIHSHTFYSHHVHVAWIAEVEGSLLNDGLSATSLQLAIPKSKRRI